MVSKILSSCPPKNTGIFHTTGSKMWFRNHGHGACHARMATWRAGEGVAGGRWGKPAARRRRGQRKRPRKFVSLEQIPK